MERGADRWGWSELSQNSGLPWSEALIEHYADRWEWCRLSGNAALPWSEALIEHYADQWQWSWLSYNTALPWSHTLFDRFAGLWDIQAVAGHYDGSVCSLTPEQIDRLMRDFLQKNGVNDKLEKGFDCGLFADEPF